MDEKTLQTLEFHKILQNLTSFTAFAVSAEKALAIRPTANIDDARRRQAETREALHLLVTRSELSIGGARDIRQAVDLCLHGAAITPQELLDIKSTLVSARTLARSIERVGVQFPHLNETASKILPPPGLIDSISRTISEHCELLDTASVKLASIRGELSVTRERLLSKLQHMVGDPGVAPFLQEALVTQRDGRYVLPLRADFKGRIKSIIHDQSSSGATLFVEPLGVVDLNNQNRELQLAERNEEHRILLDLSRQVAEHASEISQTLDAIADLDLIFARAKYAQELSATEPVLQAFPSSRRKLSADGSRLPSSVIRLYQARHPLLDQTSVVPIDVELDPQTYALVITGPNTGGKTVTLKTVGLLALMAQSGLHIPAHSGSEISLFHNIFADIGDEQSIEQSLSTFSGHITNIIRILSRADRRSLVILDELGAGTDPQEGAALARALLNHLLGRGITTLVTTHHPELKAYAHSTNGVANASVEFDLETLRPTFHLTIGLPGRSNALAIAQRLGLPEEIISAARSELNPQDLHVDDLLDEIMHQRELARQARSAADKARQESESLRAELALRLDRIEEERRTLLENTRREAEEQFQELQDELRAIRKSMARIRQPLEELKPVEEQIKKLQEAIEEPVERQLPDISPEPGRGSIALGKKVRLRTLNAKGVVTLLSGEEAEIQVGNLRIRTRLNELEPVGESPADDESQPSPALKLPYDTASPGWELDLRGQRADEALDTMDHYLDSAYLAGLPFVRIIHGKGTGKLREVIRQVLQQHPHITSYQAGAEKEGGDGVTIAKLNTG